MHRRAWLALVGVILTALPACRSRAPYEGRSPAQLERMLHDPKPAVQAQGAYGLSLLGAQAKDAVPALINALRGETLVRQNAALALGSMGPEARDAVPALTQLLADPEWTVRRQAALSLGEIGSEARTAVPALEKLTHERDSLVRKAAQDALAKIRHPHANPD